jgi:hypothetical protein
LRRLAIVAEVGLYVMHFVRNDLAIQSN